MTQSGDSLNTDLPHVTPSGLAFSPRMMQEIQLKVNENSQGQLPYAEQLVSPFGESINIGLGTYVSNHDKSVQLILTKDDSYDPDDYPRVMPSPKKEPKAIRQAKHAEGVVDSI